MRLGKIRIFEFHAFSDWLKNATQLFSRRLESAEDQRNEADQKVLFCLNWRPSTNATIKHHTNRKVDRG